MDRLGAVLVEDLTEVCLKRDPKFVVWKTARGGHLKAQPFVANVPLKLLGCIDPLGKRGANVGRQDNAGRALRVINKDPAAS